MNHFLAYNDQPQTNRLNGQAGGQPELETWALTHLLY